MKLKHEGVLEKSGRYEWGSGENPYQRLPGFTFKSQVTGLRKKGLTDVDIAKGFGIKTGELRARISYETNAQKAEGATRAQRLRDHGYSKVEIGRKMGVPESTVRGWLKGGETERINITKTVANTLADRVKEKKIYRCWIWNRVTSWNI